jgi:hypothetical protein
LNVISNENHVRTRVANLRFVCYFSSFPKKRKNEKENLESHLRNKDGNVHHHDPELAKRCVSNVCVGVDFLASVVLLDLRQELDCKVAQKSEQQKKDATRNESSFSEMPNCV